MKLFVLVVIACLGFASCAPSPCTPDKTSANPCKSGDPEAEADPGHVTYHYSSKPVVTHTSYTVSGGHSGGVVTHVSGGGHVSGHIGGHISGHVSGHIGGHVSVGHAHVVTHVTHIKTMAGGLRYGSIFRFRSSNYPSRMFRHRWGQLWVDPVSNANLYVKDSSFKIVKGLAGKGISFESVNYPGHYLRHSGWALWLNKFDHSALMKKDASFTVQNALDGKHGAVTFQSVNYPGYYMAHSGFRVYIRKFQNTALFKHDASWSPVSDPRGDEEVEEVEDEDEDEDEEVEDVDEE